jgi:hypothetical protein
MSKKYGRLNRDTYFYLKGTEFEITNEDDGMYSLNPFYEGDIDGRYVSFDQELVDVIYNHKEYTGRVVRAELEKQEEEPWWAYTNYP